MRYGDPASDSWSVPHIPHGGSVECSSDVFGHPIHASRLVKQCQCRRGPSAAYVSVKLDSCSACARGKYKQGSSTLACQTCNAGTYAQDIASPSCTQCPVGMESEAGSTNYTSCWCSAGFYRRVSSLSYHLGFAPGLVCVRRPKHYLCDAFRAFLSRTTQNPSPLITLSSLDTWNSYILLLSPSASYLLLFLLLLCLQAAL